MEPSEGLELFHECLASGRTEALRDLFSFSSAYQYWSDICASLGRAIPDEAAFRSMVEALFASTLVRDEVSCYNPGGCREKIIGPVASVVFHKRGAGNQRRVASLVREDGRWKVRTYPGVFPGELLCEARPSARPIT